MKIQDIREIARKMSVKAGKLDKVELIRAIQRAEGNYDCFASSSASTCNQMNCLWRGDCIQSVR